MRKVLIPIQIKLMSFFVVLLGLSLSFYVLYAIDLFESDKSAYIFESVKIQNDAKAQVLNGAFEQMDNQLNLLSEFSVSAFSLKKIFNQNSNLLGYAKYQKKKLIFSAFSKDFSHSKQVMNLLKQNIKELKKGSGFLYLDQINELLVRYKRIDEFVHIAFFKNDIIKNTLTDSALYRYLLIDSFANKSLIKTPLNHDQLDHSLLNDLPVGTFVQRFNNTPYIVAYRKIQTDLYSMTMVKEKLAYQASQTLISKSIYFGLLLLGVTILLIMLFSQLFTRPINKLFEASQEFAKKNFKYHISLKSKDELGVLSDSFNSMSQSILNYMDQMKEKHRLENEMQTAKLVQDSFFPNSSINHEKYDLNAYYMPATECGGDWWGYFQKEDQLIILMLDATGHGTPAALITAMGYSSLEGISQLAQENKLLTERPDIILSMINKTMAQMQGQMMATAFCCCINLKNGSVNYSNASHNPPLKLNCLDHEFNKESLEPLIGQLNSRLGENLQEEYKYDTITMKPNEKLIFYTDGLIEGENKEAKAWGKRRFHKSLLTNGKLESNELVENIIDEAYRFYSETQQADDITLVALKLKE